MASEENGTGDSSGQRQPAPPVVVNGKTQTTGTAEDRGDQNADPSKNGSDQDLVRWTRIVGLFTGLLFVAAVLQFLAMRGRQGVMQGQFDEMRDEQRSWLRVVPRLQGPLVNEDGALVTNLGLDLNNIGPLPAIDVIAKAEIMRYKMLKLGTTGELLTNVCDDAPRTLFTDFDPTAGSDIVFPGQPDSLDVIAIDASSPSKVVGLKNYFVQPPSDTDAVNTIAVDGTITLIYCVAYKSAKGTVFHHTGGTMYIAFPNGIEALKEGQKIRVGDMKLQRPSFDWHNFAD